ncbi:MAG: LPS-assembly protein LptD [Sedimentitalea sp.]|nr:LPS-assembly protein LptD [Sedimentitalea sp.]
MRRAGRIMAAALLGALWLAGAARGQSPQTAAEPALLVADQVYVTAERQLVAEGNVEALQGDIRLQASRITFDRASGKLTIDGPIRIDQGGSVTVLATSAELDSGLQNGLLAGARLVLDQQLQLASLQMTRVGGRYSQLYKTAVTSCHVCADGRPPLWQIRARKVIHDQQERQLYFEDAQFRVLDVPILYLPRLRLPDPTLERARGFLIPAIRTTSQLGTGLRLPYFIPLGPSRDLTLSPYISPKTKTLDFRYRQAFRTGDIAFEGAFTRDDLQPGDNRGYLFGTGSFDLARDFQLNFDIQTVSDNSYLVDYGLPDLDRLQSDIELIRVKRDTYFGTGLIYYESLRDSEQDSTLPTRVADAAYQKRFFPKGIGGEARLTLDLHGHQRDSSEDILGRDIARATADIDWRRNWVLGPGLRADWLIGLAADSFAIRQDSTYPPEVTRLTPRTALSLRYPLTRTAANGVVHVLEPIAQLGWSQVNGSDVPNDESGFVEFDQGNLLSLSRFPAPDRREDGAAFVYGLNWSAYAPAGWQASAGIGQVFRQDADPSFTASSGLAGTSSDLLLSGQVILDNGLALTGRGLLAGDFSFSKAELRGDWIAERARISGSYVYLDSDPAEAREDALSEIWFDSAYQINPNWTASANLRYDTSTDQPIRAGIGVIWRNECVTVDVSLNRRYTSSASVEPSTDFGFTIGLNGFAVDAGTEKYRRTCS